MTQSPSSNSKKRWNINWTTVWTALGALAAIFGVIVAYLALSPSPPSTSQFTFQASGASSTTGDVSIYEVTSQLAYLPRDLDQNTYKLSVNFDVQVTVSRPEDIVGRVNVQIRTAEGEIIPAGYWGNFAVDYVDPILVPLSPELLIHNSGLSAQMSLPEPTEETLSDSHIGEFRIEVVKDSEVLAHHMIRVLHTPWSHTTTLSATVISAGSPVSAYVTIHNLGQPADMVVRFNLLKIKNEATTDTMRSTLTRDTGWYSGRTFEVLSLPSNFIDAPMVKESITVRYEITPNLLKACQIYLLETSAIKKLDYLTFTSGDWRTSTETYRARDAISLSVIVVLGDESEPDCSMESD